MIKHIVMLALKEEALGRKKDENVVLLKAMLDDLPAKVPGIVALEAASEGIFTAVPSADIVLYSAFKTREDLKAYAVHPEHLKVVEFILAVTAERRVVDYEV